MQQFGLVSVYPRSIAWLIRSDEWERLETVVKYNSAMLGGYYNVIIPITDREMPCRIVCNGSPSQKRDMR